MRVTAFARAPLTAAGIARLATAVLGAEHGRLAALSITLVGPGRMRELNRRHLGHDRVTDVIAFSMPGIGNRESGPGVPSPIPPSRFPVVGDIYVCPAVATRNARLHDTTVKDELRRLVIHGVLHALGYDHPADATRTRSPLWRRQERYLTRFGALAR